MLLSLFFGLSLAAMNCPKSPAWFGHAGMKITTVAEASCADVKAEMYDRVNGQCNPPASSCSWYDPHNLGYYHDVVESAVGASTKLAMQHLSGNKKYTDKLIFTLTDSNSRCLIEACSESQVTSYLDFSTNYCNLEMLFCGSSQGCKTMEHDFTNTVGKTEAMAGATQDMSDCLKVSGISRLVKAVTGI